MIAAKSNPTTGPGIAGSLDTAGTTDGEQTANGQSDASGAPAGNK
jgi:hypothetical protein